MTGGCQNKGSQLFPANPVIPQPQMPAMLPSSSTSAADLLRELDKRQEQVLTDLDDLNSRIERVIESYLENRSNSLNNLCPDGTVAKAA